MTAIAVVGAGGVFFSRRLRLQHYVRKRELGYEDASGSPGEPPWRAAWTRPAGTSAGLASVEQ